MLDWAVVREPLLLLEAAGFVTEGQFWKSLIAYVFALFFGLLTTLGLELGSPRLEKSTI